MPSGKTKMKLVEHLLQPLLLVAALSAGPVFAQPVPNDALYQQLGGQPGLVRLMDDFMTRLLADPRMNRFFNEVDQNNLKVQLVAQFCEVSGGPCKRKGPDMKKAHDGFDINKSNFNTR